jgi:DNA modification methylase
MFRLGNHVLLCGDSRDKDALARLIANRKIKAVVCDPPYGVALTKDSLKPMKKNKAILNDHLQSDAEYAQFTKDWIEAIKPHLERKNAWYIFNCDKMIFALRNGMLSAGMKFAQLLIWVKTHAVMARMDYAPQHELIAYGWYGTHEFIKSVDKSVIIHPRPNKSPYHPSTKPIGLIRQLVLNSTRIGDVVFDGFLGSGTTLLACEQTKRVCIAVEYDTEYCQTVIDRWEKLTKLTVEKIYE